MITHVDTQYGLAARNRLAEARTPTLDSARAALESFYYAFNHRDSTVLAQVWLADPLVLSAYTFTCRLAYGLTCRSAEAGVPVRLS